MDPAATVARTPGTDAGKEVVGGVAGASTAASSDAPVADKEVAVPAAPAQILQHMGLLPDTIQAMGLLPPHLKNPTLQITSLTDSQLTLGPLEESFATFLPVSLEELKLIAESIATQPGRITVLGLFHHNNQNLILEALAPLLPHVRNAILAKGHWTSWDAEEFDLIVQHLPRDLSSLRLFAPRSSHLPTTPINFGQICQQFPNFQGLHLVGSSPGWNRDKTNDLLEVLQMPSLESLTVGAMRHSSREAWDPFLNAIICHPKLRLVIFRQQPQVGYAAFALPRHTMDSILVTLRINCIKSRPSNANHAKIVEELVRARHRADALGYLMDGFDPTLYAPHAFHALQHKGQPGSNINSFPPPPSLTQEEQWQEVTKVFGYLNNTTDRANYFEADNGSDTTEARRRTRKHKWTV